MARYSVKTKLSPKKAIKEALAYFGKDGLGLEVVEHNETCANFRGGGGHVNIIACEEDGTEVEIETREWDYHVRGFMREIG